MDVDLRTTNVVAGYYPTPLHLRTSVIVDAINNVWSSSESAQLSSRSSGESGPSPEFNMGTEDVLVQLSRTVTGMEGQTMTTTRTLLARPSSDSSTSHFVTDDKDIETTRPESSPPSSPSQLLGQTSSSSRQTMADMVVSLASVDDGSSEVKANREGPKGPRPEHSPSISPRSPPISELQSTRVEVEIKTPGIPSGVRFPTSSAVRPRTSLFLSSPIAGLSLPSSPRSYSSKSLRQEDSDEMGDDIASQAIASSEDDEMDLPAGARNSAPQLIMPSIKIPSRRPFTDRGKHIGRIKVLIAGGSGTWTIIRQALRRSIGGTDDAVKVLARRP